MTENPQEKLENTDVLGTTVPGTVSYVSPVIQGAGTAQRPKTSFARASSAPQKSNAGPVAGYDGLGMFGQFLVNILLMLTQFIDPSNQKHGGIVGLISKAFGFDSLDQYSRLRDDVRTNGREHARNSLDYTNFDSAAALAAARAGEAVIGKNAYDSNLLELIGKHESAGDYNRVYSAGGIKRVDLTNMTINEVLDWQRAYVAEQKAQGVPEQSRSSAAGKYQVIQGTLRASVEQMGLSGNEKFDAAMQDKIALHLMKGRGYDDYMAGRIGEGQFMERLSKEWASLPKDAGGQSFYAGVGNNRAGTSANKVLGAMLLDKETLTDKFAANNAKGGTDESAPAIGKTDSLAAVAPGLTEKFVVANNGTTMPERAPTTPAARQAPQEQPTIQPA